MDGTAWWATIHGVAKSRKNKPIIIPKIISANLSISRSQKHNYVIGVVIFEIN